jgi:hypothetical protein
VEVKQVCSRWNEGETLVASKHVNVVRVNVLRLLVVLVLLLTRLSLGFEKRRGRGRRTRRISLAFEVILR